MLKIVYHTRQYKINARRVMSEGLWKLGRRIISITFRAPKGGFSEGVTFGLSLEG